MDKPKKGRAPLDRRSLLAGMVAGGAVALDWGVVGTMAFFEEYLVPKRFSEAKQLLGELHTKLIQNGKRIDEMATQGQATKEEIERLRAQNEELQTKIKEHAEALEDAKKAAAK